MNSASQKDQTIWTDAAYPDAVRIIDQRDALEIARQQRQPLLEQGIDQPVLVPKMVVDRRRAVAATIDQLPYRKTPVARFQEQLLGGVEDHPTSLGPTLAAALFGGM